jgi:hypothetical protein
MKIIELLHGFVLTEADPADQTAYLNGIAANTGKMISDINPQNLASAQPRPTAPLSPAATDASLNSMQAFQARQGVNAAQPRPAAPPLSPAAADASLNSMQAFQARQGVNAAQPAPAQATLVRGGALRQPIGQ